MTKAEAKAEASKRWYHKNKDEINRRRRERYATNPRKREHNRQFRENHKEELNLRRREKYAADPDRRKKARLKSAQFRRENPTYDRDRKREMRKRCVEYLGGKCEVCGLEDDPIVYDFHHKDPTQKDFQLSGRYLRYRWERIEVELKKCQLVCAICHRKVHYST